MSDCCEDPRLEPDARWEPLNGPVLERVLCCASCGALVIEEWHSRAGYDGAEDREWREHSVVDEARVAARFRKR